MKVKILVNLGRQDYPEQRFCEGEIHDVNEAVAAKLLKHGLATSVADENKSDKFTELRKSKPRSESKEEK